MKKFLICVLLVLISIPAYADHFFPETDVSDLRVTRVDTDEGKAWIVDREGYEAEVILGDKIGTEGGVVIKLHRSFIIVQFEGSKMKMTVIRGFISPQ